MNKTIKKLLSLALAFTLATAVISFSFSVNASETEQVHVIVRNDTYKVADGAPWEGVLVDEWVDIDSSTTTLTAFIDAIEKNNYTQVGAENGYITEVNGIASGDNDFMSGWMGTLNDWFTNELLGAYTVENGKLKAGDEICIAYTSDWGEDLGSSWYNNYTTLKSLSVDGGSLSADFNSDVYEYNLEINVPVQNITVNPVATNKNFQVRTYKNEFTPTVDNSEYKRNSKIEVKDGDTVFIGVGDPSWPSMGTSEAATVYKLNIEYKRLLGDTDADGELTVKDATEISKYIVELASFDESDKIVADYDKDGDITVKDATEIQKYIVSI